MTIALHWPILSVFCPRLRFIFVILTDLHDCLLIKMFKRPVEAS